MLIPSIVSIAIGVIFFIAVFVEEGDRSKLLGVDGVDIAEHELSHQVEKSCRRVGRRLSGVA